MTIELIRLKLSAQRALLGNVTSSLRAVCVKSEENKVIVRFYYHGEVLDREYAESTMDELIADLHADQDGTETYFDYEILQIDFPKKMPLIGSWVYYRHELIEEEDN